MKTKTLAYTIAFILLAGSLFSCVGKSDEIDDECVGQEFIQKLNFITDDIDHNIDISDIDFSNIECLNEQPLQVIKACLEGKWRLQYRIIHGILNSVVMIDTSEYMHINHDNIILYYHDRDENPCIIDSPILWARNTFEYRLTYNHVWCGGRIIEANHFAPMQIKNDTLITDNNKYYTKY